MSWKVTKVGKLPKLKNAVLIEGLPGIGNVGKIVVDFLIDELKAEMVYDFFSYSFPHSVFVNEDNLVELPTMEMYYKRIKGQDLLFLIGDIQPIDENSCYEFCDVTLDLMAKIGCKKVITIGGIGLQIIPKKPKVYVTGNDRKQINDFKKGININDKIHGVVGPIVGVSGVMIGMAAKRKVPGLVVLGETFGHPMYLGVKAAEEILKVINKKFSLNINIKKLEKEVSDVEAKLMEKAEEALAAGAGAEKKPFMPGKETAYIG